jgi:hypothetical protein
MKDFNEKVTDKVKGAVDRIVFKRVNANEIDSKSAGSTVRTAARLVE